MPASELLRHLSTMTTGELLQSDLTGRAKFVGANDRLPTDERADIDTRELLSASWTHRRVRGRREAYAGRYGVAYRASIAQSGHGRTVDIAWRQVAGNTHHGDARTARLFEPARWISGGRLVGPGRSCPS
jgi:hypothetical protein